jgi:hypothetical protein
LKSERLWERQSVPQSEKSGALSPICSVNAMTYSPYKGDNNHFELILL